VKKESKFDYRSQCPSIDLPKEGRVPNLIFPLSPESASEFDACAALLEDLWNNASDMLRADQKRLTPSVVVTEEEVKRAWHLWMQSHQSFFCFFALLAHAYDRLSEATREQTMSRVKEWAERVSVLWRGAGALMLYGCDFHPVMPIYCEFIRPEMPGAFSGFWLREWLAVREASLNWQRLVSADMRQEIQNADAAVTRGRQIYHAYHDIVMHAAVPDGKSLAQGYRRQNGCPYQVKDGDLDVYDGWFKINRIPQTALQFLRVACGALTQTLTEISAGNCLSHPAIEDIVFGVQEAVRIFGEWLGPIPETSKYYPKSRRGE
jgi:hypothetical protein